MLYVNGKEVGQQTAHRVFKFNVALEEGFNTILAVAGDVKDSITLEKVEKEPDYYTLPEFNERQEGVANWFKPVSYTHLDVYKRQSEMRSEPSEDSSTAQIGTFVFLQKSQFPRFPLAEIIA